MFVRFITHRIDPNSGRRQGLFAAASDLRKSGRLSAYDEDRLDLIQAWFDDNLLRPDRLSLSARPHRKEQAISWFKDKAVECIVTMRDYAVILQEYDIAVDMIRTSRPGFILYEDQNQVAAYPYADTPT